MFEVTGYEYPNVFVRCRRTAETYVFEVGNDGALTHSEARYDQGDARRTAIAFLGRLKATVEAVEHDPEKWKPAFR